MGFDYHFNISIRGKSYEFDLVPKGNNSSSTRYDIKPANDKDLAIIQKFLGRVQSDTPTSTHDLAKRLKQLPVVTMAPVSKVDNLAKQTILSSKKISKITRQKLKKANAYINKLKKSDYSGIILVAVGGKIVRNEAIMPAKLEQKKFTPKTPFNILSIGKLFTTVGIMKLVQEGDIGLDDSIKEKKLLNPKDYSLDGGDCDEIYKSHKLRRGDLEAFMNDERVTVHHLLTHTAGLIESSSHSSYDQTMLGKRKYSNLGFLLLARIIAKKNKKGLSFLEYVKENIMKASDIKDDGSIKYIDSPPKKEEQANQFSNSRPSGRTQEIPNTHRIPSPDGNGCFWMTSSDLLKFASALAQNNKLLNAKSKKIMLTPDPDFDKRALGFYVIKEGDGSPEHPKIIGHPGEELGASSDLQIIDIDGKEPITLICLSNLSTNNDVITKLSKAMLEEDQ